MSADIVTRPLEGRAAPVRSLNLGFPRVQGWRGRRVGVPSPASVTWFIIGAQVECDMLHSPQAGRVDAAPGPGGNATPLRALRGGK